MFANNGRCVQDFAPHWGDMVLSNQPDNHSATPVKGCRVLAVTSFALEVGQPMWRSNGKPIIGNRLIVVTKPDEVRSHYHSLGSGGTPFPWQGAETGDFSTEFDPAEWPLCHEITRVADSATAMALAGVRLADPQKQEQDRSSQDAAAVAATGRGIFHWTFGPNLSESATLPPPAEHNLWDWLDHDVVDMIVKNDLVANAMTRGEANFRRTLRMRLICKGFRDALDGACANVLGDCVRSIKTAEKSQLIKDWQRVREACFRGDIPPWTINAYRMQFYEDDASVRGRFLQYARMKLRKPPKTPLPL